MAVGGIHGVPSESKFIIEGLHRPYYDNSNAENKGAGGFYDDLVNHKGWLGAPLGALVRYTTIKTIKSKEDLKWL